MRPLLRLLTGRASESTSREIDTTHLQHHPAHMGLSHPRRQPTDSHGPSATIHQHPRTPWHSISTQPTATTSQVHGRQLPSAGFVDLHLMEDRDHDLCACGDERHHHSGGTEWCRVCRGHVNPDMRCGKFDLTMVYERGDE